jgi:hypothetical protein
MRMQAMNNDYFPEPGCFGRLALFVLVLASLACGTQIPANISTVVPETVNKPALYLQQAVLTHDAPRYVTTGTLNVRAEPNANSQILAVLDVGAEITIAVLDLRGDDCYQGEWYAITEPYSGYVCSLYVVRK